MIKTKDKPCKGNHKTNKFPGCNKVKPIYKFGLCKSCFMDWCFNDPAGQEYYKKQFIPAGKKKVEKEEKKEIIQAKQAIKTKGSYLKDLQTIVNRIVRLIDNDKGCISCDHGWNEPWTRQRHAGHRLSVGSCPELRFNFINIFAQCSICNNWKSGNERAYDIGLEKHYGLEYLNKVQDLRVKYPSLHISIEEIKEAVKIAKTIEKEILSGKTFTRDELNIKLRIYESNN